MKVHPHALWGIVVYYTPEHTYRSSLNCLFLFFSFFPSPTETVTSKKRQHPWRSIGNVGYTNNTSKRIPEYGSIYGPAWREVFNNLCCISFRNCLDLNLSAVSCSINFHSVCRWSIDFQQTYTTYTYESYRQVLQPASNQTKTCFLAELFFYSRFSSIYRTCT